MLTQTMPAKCPLQQNNHHWKNGVQPSSTTPEPCRIFSTENWSCWCLMMAHNFTKTLCCCCFCTLISFNTSVSISSFVFFSFIWMYILPIKVNFTWLQYVFKLKAGSTTQENHKEPVLQLPDIHQPEVRTEAAAPKPPERTVLKKVLVLLPLSVEQGKTQRLHG